MTALNMMVDTARRLRRYERDLIGKVEPAARLVREEVGEWIRLRLTPVPVLLSKQEKSCLRRLLRDGVVVVDQHWPRAEALALRDELLTHLASGRNVDFPGGAYSRFWDGRAYDQGVRRIYHVDRLVHRLTGFRHDPFVLKLAHAYYGAPFHSGALVYQHNLQSNRHTRSYHVDVFGKEFKAFLYLDDVTDENGPFTYLKGTHRSHLTRLRRQMTARPGMLPTSFSQEDLGRLVNREVRVCGPAGTLILADVRGIHRGSPQIERDRSVLVNYLYPHAGDVRLDA
jgi:hypothetical protein